MDLLYSKNKSTGNLGKYWERQAKLILQEIVDATQNCADVYWEY